MVSHVKIIKREWHKSNESAATNNDNYDMMINNDLNMIRDEDGAAETASNATDDVDNTDTEPAK